MECVEDVPCERCEVPFCVAWGVMRLVFVLIVVQVVAVVCITVCNMPSDASVADAQLKHTSTIVLFMAHSRRPRKGFRRGEGREARSSRSYQRGEKRSVSLTNAPLGHFRLFFNPTCVPGAGFVCMVGRMFFDAT